MHEMEFGLEGVDAVHDVIEHCLLLLSQVLITPLPIAQCMSRSLSLSLLSRSPLSLSCSRRGGLFGFFLRSYMHEMELWLEGVDAVHDVIEHCHFLLYSRSLKLSPS